MICPFGARTSFVALLLIAVAGCHREGPQIARVEGQVFLDGRPLSGATIFFEPRTGRKSVARTDKDGHFKLLYSSTTDGAIVGDHLVRITTFQDSVFLGPGNGRSEVVPEMVPECYNKQSELFRTVKSDWWVPNWFVFHLDSASDHASG